MEERSLAKDGDTLSEKISEFKKLKLSIDEYENKGKDEHSPKVFIFTSIDLVNSTNYKEYNKNWPEVFSEFFAIVENEFKNRNSNIHVWKYVGDEVLFYEQVTALKSILECPSQTYRNLIHSQQKLYDNKPECKNKLYLKATLWIAAVKDFMDDKNPSINNVIPQLSESVRDFIGADIDEGFRISKYSSQRKLVIDSALAYILYKNRSAIYTAYDYNIEDRLKIVGYKALKGIWNGRLYPIMWYHSNWSTPESILLYDEHENCEIANKLVSNEYKTEPIEKIVKILEELNLIETKVNIIEDIVSKMDKNYMPIYPSISNLLELHCAVVCINIKTNKAFIAKRSSHKEKNSGLWEFGCAKAIKTKSISECIEDEYRKDFSFKLKILMDTIRGDDPEPIPIAVYKIDEYGKSHKGIIFVAQVLNDIGEVKLSKKHEEYRWISEDEVDKFTEKAVPDFRDTLNKAFQLYKKYKEK